MKYICIITCLLVLGCSSPEAFSEFPLKTQVSMRTDDFQSVKDNKTEFRSYLTPYARIEGESQNVLLGFIFHDDEYIQGVAYLLDPTNQVLDTLNVSVVDPPTELWAELGSEITLFESGGMMEEGPLPPGRTSNTWVDTLRYRIGKTAFELID